MLKNSFPRISFGIIVLNGEPFTKYCLRALYPFAYEIIVVEGGHQKAKAVCTSDGHSIDGTLENLWRFKQEEDPEDKLQIITRDGFWPQRDEFGKDRTPQSRAYAERATGDYLWQVDIDEFYRHQDMEAIITMLKDDPSITAMSFKVLSFWGSPNYIVEGWWFYRLCGKDIELFAEGDIYHRLFKWGPRYRYITHEPPTVYDDKGRDLRSLNWVCAKTLARRRIYLYHYAFLFPSQVKQKARLYQDEKPERYGKIKEESEDNYFQMKNPYRIHNHCFIPSWLERFRGSHPAETIRMWDDLRSDKAVTGLRRTDDIEMLLNSWWYPIGILGFKFLEPMVKILRYPYMQIKILSIKISKLREIIFRRNKV